MRTKSIMGAVVLLLGLWLLGTHLASADSACGGYCRKVTSNPLNHPSLDSNKMPQEDGCCCGGPVSCCKLPRPRASAGKTLFVFTLSSDKKFETGRFAHPALGGRQAPSLGLNLGPSAKVVSFCTGPPVPLFLRHLSFRC